MTAEITKAALASMQVCVPFDWTHDQVTEYANRENPTGIDSRWQIRRAGDAALRGDPERQECASKSDHVHIMLDC